MLNNVDLVTITCARDFSIQQLQSYSMELMLTEPCDHYIVVEDSKLDLETWHNMLDQYYVRHRLHLISGTSLISSAGYANDSYKKNGWHRSAVLKLLISKHIQSKKYLILDSKNFFVHSQTLMDWPIQDGNGLVTKYNCHGWTEIEEFCLKHSLPLPSEVYMSAMPFMVDTDIVKEIVKYDIETLFFDKQQWWSSEVLIYSIFTQHAGNQLQPQLVPNVTFWNTERQLSIETLKDIHNWTNMRSFGLHRHVVDLGTDLHDLTEFLIELGFDRKTVENTLEQYRQGIKND